MLLPKYHRQELMWVVLSNLVLLAGLWLTQLIRVKHMVPLRSVWLMSVLAIIVNYGPLIVKKQSNSLRIDQLRLDLNLTLAVYGWLYVLFPTAFNLRLPDMGLPMVGLLFSMIAVPLSYVPQNSIIGIRIPQTYASPAIWHKVNRLGAQVGFLLGLMLFLTAALFGSKVGLVVLAGGVGVLVVSTWWYANHLVL